MSEAETYYHFISSLRQGLAASLEPPSNGKRARTELVLHAERREIASGEWVGASEPIRRTVELYGPGDLSTFDERMIVRRDPEPDSGNFEPNYFPAVEFADPDFPWRFSPEQAVAGGSSVPESAIALTPWIALIVLVAEDRGDEGRKEFEELPRRGNQRPAIRVSSQKDLPNPAHAWRWAHVQVTAGVENLIGRELAERTPADRDGLSDDDVRVMLAAEIRELASAHPELLVSRLLCPRRLKPSTLYRAFIVPTYKLGWAAALDSPDAHKEAEGSSATELAWDHQAAAPLELPYFHDWEFRTSARGDFEYLVRLLEPRPLPGLGLREIDCERPGFGLSVVRSDGVEEEATHRLEMEGALESLQTDYTPWGRDRPSEADDEGGDGSPGLEAGEFQTRLAALLDAARGGIRVTLPEDYGAAGVEDLSFEVLDDGRSVRMAWGTSGETTGVVDYGPEQNASGVSTYPEHEISDTPATSHSVDLACLVPEKKYHFRLRVRPEGGSAEIVTKGGTLSVPLPAVVPPIYGRWHAARETVSAEPSTKGWLDVLNLDPRHRAAAGLGAEVVRKQQEALMASAWDQIGAIEAANDVLRRAQLGRDSSVFLHGRLHHLALEDSLRLTAPVHRRIARADDAGDRQTLRRELAEETRLPGAALAPAFRRIARPAGPIRKRQETRRTDMVRRMVTGKDAQGQEDPLRPAGPHPTPAGTPQPCGITERMYQQFVLERLEGREGPERDAGSTRDAAGVSGRGFARRRGEDAVLARANRATPPARDHASRETRGVVPSPRPPSSPREIPVPESAKRFCDDRIGCEQLKKAIASSEDAAAAAEPRERRDALRSAPMAVVLSPSATESADATETTLVEDVCTAFDELLRPAVRDAGKPRRDPSYLPELRAYVETAIDPRTTVPHRTKRRLRLTGSLASRFEEGAPGDPLDEIMAHPRFPQPMYEPLRDISQSLILPGIEKIPQNTVGLLRSNRRFLECYMVGLNHEFARELLWRRYPTDQRGSYFRQFWDVDEYVPKPDDLDDEGHLEDEVREGLRDIRPIHGWAAESRLGRHDSGIEDEQAEGHGETGESSGDMLILVVRGDLLKRYPNALVYSVDARDATDDDEPPPDLMPRLPEHGDPTGERVFPVFRGSLGADLVFFGFPFEPELARSVRNEDDVITQAGKFFVIEERISEARFGLDSEGDVPVERWDDLHWGTFGLDPGDHLDDSGWTRSIDGETWGEEADAALRARITLQKPARLAVHADQMLQTPDGQAAQGGP